MSGFIMQTPPGHIKLSKYLLNLHLYSSREGELSTRCHKFRNSLLLLSCESVSISFSSYRHRGTDLRQVDGGAHQTAFISRI